ncbi:MAG TPA: YbjN domain-containing protein [Polyangiales bacterium]|nr:YbjN domain-containing protein [Polyangiales bacterium]
MRSRDDIESYLARAEVPYEEVGDDGMWLVRDSSLGENIAIKAAGSLLLFRVKVLELREVTDKAALLEELLRLNASDLVHGAYGISEDAVVLTCTLQVENLDYNELQAVLDDFSLALANHYDKLSKFRSAR